MAELPGNEQLDDAFCALKAARQLCVPDDPHVLLVFKSVTIAELTPKVPQSSTCADVLAVPTLANEAPGFALIVKENADDDVLALPSLAVNIKPETAPDDDGVPDSAPVAALTLNQDGLPDNP